VEAAAALPCCHSYDRVSVEDLSRVSLETFQPSGACMHVRTVIVSAAAMLLAACTAAESPQTQANELAELLPTGWTTDVVEDEQAGTYVVAAPETSAVWHVGGTTDEVRAATEGTSWATFWLSAIEGATSESSNVRTTVADPSSVPDSVVSWHVNVNAQDAALELRNLDELEESVVERFEAQDLEVVDSGIAGWAGREVVTVSFEVPAEVFAGEDRLVRQWFIPERNPDVMWSFTCDAPDGPHATDELCRTGLEGFRTAPDGPDPVN
jgi:hypothetical protein